MQNIKNYLSFIFVVLVSNTVARGQEASLEKGNNKATKLNNIKVDLNDKVFLPDPSLV